MTTIAKKRAEILRLIAKVANGSVPESEDPPQLPQAAQSRVHRRRQTLAQVKERKKELEKRVLGHQLLELHQMLENRVTAIEQLLEQAPAKGLLPGPGAGARPDPAPELARQLEESVISGAIREGLTADVLQMVSSNMMTGVFTVESDGVQIRLYFNEGEICHGEGPDLHGESAFFAAMAVEHGRFFFRETNDLPEKRTISSKTQFLILEALRQIDESRA